MNYYVYIIKSIEGFHYTGQTSDLEKRLFEHNHQLSHSTKHGHNWEIIFKEEYTTRSEAMKREKWLKSGAGRNWLVRNLPGWSPPRAE
jgi:putative endonuclease